MNDTHAQMALDYGIDVTVAAAEFVKFDVMGSTLLCMELQTKAHNSRDNRTRFGTVAEDEKGVVPTIIGGVGAQLGRRTVQRDAKGGGDD